MKTSRVRVVERPPARRHLEDHDAQRVDVGTRVDRFAADLLRSHVRQGADEVAAAVRGRLIDVAGRAGQLRDAEVEHLHALPFGVDMMLAGLRSRWMMPRSCASSSAAATSPASVTRSRSDNGDRAICSDSVAPGNELHHEEVDAIRAVEVVDGGDVRVFSRDSAFGFTPEPPPRPRRRAASRVAAP